MSPSIILSRALAHLRIVPTWSGLSRIPFYASNNWREDSSLAVISRHGFTAQLVILSKDSLKRGITLRQSLHPMKFSFIGEIIISFKRTRWANNVSSPMVMSITFFFFTLSVSLYFHSHHFQFLFSFNRLSSEVLAVRAFLDAGTPLPRMAQACLLPSRVQNICFSLWNSCRYEVKSFADGPDISSWIGYWEPQQNLTLLTLLVQFCKYQPYFGFKTSLPRKQVLRNRRKCNAPRTNTETSEQYHRK